MDLKVFIGIFLGLGLSSIIMYGRKNISIFIRAFVALSGLIVGVYGLLVIDQNKKSDLIIYWGLFSTGLYFIFDRILFILNHKLQQRDFILWLKGSNEINFYGRNPHVIWLDKVSSILSLVFIVFLMGLGAHLFRLK